MQDQFPDVDVSFAKPADAEGFVALLRAIAHESDFMLLTVEETAAQDVETQRRRIEEFSKAVSPRKLLLARCEGRVVGFLGYGYAPLKKIQHIARDIAVGVLQEFQGRGIAQKLFACAEQEWKSAGKSVARFSVMEPNTRAMQLYTKLGFAVEGRVNMSVYQHGRYVDEFVMWKKL